jgi:ATP-binding cassette subfamily B protein
MKTKSFSLYVQLDSMDCGPTCLRMIAKHYGRSYNQQNLRERCFITREGVSMLGISDAAESIGMHTQAVRITLEQLIDHLSLPCILHWNQKHFVVMYAVDYNRKGLFRSDCNREYKFYIADPAGEKYVMTQEEFCRCL